MLLFNAVQLSVWTEIVVTSTSPIKSQLLFSFEAIGIEVQSRLMCVSFIVDLKRNDSSFNWQFFFAQWAQQSTKRQSKSKDSNDKRKKANFTLIKNKKTIHSSFPPLQTPTINKWRYLIIRCILLGWLISPDVFRRPWRRYWASDFPL